MNNEVIAMAKFDPNSPEFKVPFIDIKNIKCEPKLKFILDLPTSGRKTEEGEVAEGNYFVERCCSCCGAPIAMNRTTVEKFKAAISKGKETNNFTEGELKRFYGLDSKDIDGVIYDDSGTCSACHSYY